jgi:hypothetical protein
VALIYQVLVVVVVVVIMMGLEVLEVQVEVVDSLAAVILLVVREILHQLVRHKEILVELVVTLRVAVVVVLEP